MNFKLIVFLEGFPTICKVTLRRGKETKSIRKYRIKIQSWRFKKTLFYCTDGLNKPKRA